jgi:hypothetical protein
VALGFLLLPCRLIIRDARKIRIPSITPLITAAVFPGCELLPSLLDKVCESENKTKEVKVPAFSDTASHSVVATHNRSLADRKSVV